MSRITGERRWAESEPARVGPVCSRAIENHAEVARKALATIERSCGVGRRQSPPFQSGLLSETERPKVEPRNLEGLPSEWCCMSRRNHRAFEGLALLAITSVASWYGMMIVHELGHVVGALLSGGNVERVVLGPLNFSRTDVSPNPHPRIEIWAGPVLGSLLPLGLWLIASHLRLRLAFLLRFFAGFCLVANGAYFASAIALPVGDAEELVRLGSARWIVAAPGVLWLVGGLAVWNGMGAHFGRAGGVVDRSALIASCIALATLLGFMVAWNA